MDPIVIAATLVVVAWSAGRDTAIRARLLRRRSARLRQASTPALRNQVRQQYRAELAVYLATQVDPLIGTFRPRMGRQALDVTV